MKTGPFLILLATFLAIPLHSFAQTDASSFGGRASRPVCVYKGVMTDAEIEVCTGRRVHYNYAIYYGRDHAYASGSGFIPTMTVSYREPGSRAMPRRTRH